MNADNNSLGYLDSKISEILSALQVSTISEANAKLDELEKQQKP